MCAYVCMLLYDDVCMSVYVSVCSSFFCWGKDSVMFTCSSCSWIFCAGFLSLSGPETWKPFCVKHITACRHETLTQVHDGNCYKDSTCFIQINTTARLLLRLMEITAHRGCIFTQISESWETRAELPAIIWHKFMNLVFTIAEEFTVSCNVCEMSSPSTQLLENITPVHLKQMSLLLFSLKS